MSREKVYNRTMESFKSDLALQGHAFQQAEIYGDIDGQAEALKEMARIKRDMQDAHEIAVEDARGMQSAQATNRYGLSPEEIDIAHKSYTERGDRSDLTKDQKEQLYAQQKAKLQHMKRTGEYSVDQGQVFK